MWLCRISFAPHTAEVTVLFSPSSLSEGEWGGNSKYAKGQAQPVDGQYLLVTYTENKDDVCGALFVCFFIYLCMLSAGNWTWIIYLACNENGDMEGCSSTVKLCPCMNINETSLFPLSQEATPSGSGSCSSQDTDISLPGALSSSNAASAKRNDTNTFTKYHHW